MQAIEITVITDTACVAQDNHYEYVYRRLGAKGSYLTLVRVADRIL